MATDSAQPSAPNSAPHTARIGPAVVFAMLALILIGSASAAYFMHKSSQSLVHELDSPDPHRVAVSLEMLRDRQDPAAVPRAQKLLANANPQIAIGAALYLGNLAKPESIPYLIQALKTADSDQAREIETYLNDMTGEDFGTDYAAWKNWLDKNKNQSR